MAIVLGVDVGGTHTNFGIIKIDSKKAKILFNKKILSIGSFNSHLKIFLQESKRRGYKVEKGCFAVAGPIEGSRVHMSNTNWIIDVNLIKKRFGLKKVILINDFEAVGYAINVLKKNQIRIIKRGNEEKFGNKSIIGAGTGLGKSFLTFNKKNKCYIPHPSEGGHADLPLFYASEFHLAKFIQKVNNTNRVLYYEDVVSGRGIENIYKYLKHHKYHNAPNQNSKEISNSRRKNKCSKEALDIFIKFYARAARNFALETLPYGGLYIAGGIAIGNVGAFSGKFKKEFIDNPSLKEVLDNIQIQIIIEKNVGIVGAAYAINLIK
ncbi:glucokinase [Nanoarchaeota archaeon]